MTPTADHAAAVLFDIDGTLVDSNYLHVHAWTRAFHEAGVEADAWCIHRLIGMDGSRLVASLAPNIDDETRQRLKDLHSRYYRELCPLLRVLSGGREILDRVASMRLQVVLATSAPEDELSILRAVLDRDGVVAAVTSAADVDSAKPDPGIVKVALQRAGVPAARAVLVGDSVWDARAGVRAGVPIVGLLSGGISREELTGAGAAVVFEDPRDLMEHLSETPIASLSSSVLGVAD
ncbi:HAD family hydrolase [Mycobacterium sp.]|uniref:HAD family hydrolase n=1 Tax=Mycobacterium sp. TaxID=1785 RepID=UPI002C477C51|nr:HAD family hydrolase [Mycobacterium sp.]HME48854.1 HAD family hydrolase [Mycobacterium sp.]